MRAAPSVNSCCSIACHMRYDRLLGIWQSSVSSHVLDTLGAHMMQADACASASLSSYIIRSQLAVNLQSTACGGFVQQLEHGPLIEPMSD
eukprot:CAMPEP_0181235130 /NCGR_PEP_ID=MMETSP1096-20121128/37394_1 /TAXON_ID=156174 ORGANISM="Chrysochromulina ericina, Strain CCMP281" /NCGR_SAMPLE_ID=MMETSP1096 /ASSEMBLY_ACC=CAM_ASM_000453 /LENGTH=89 /DNA_ID=CAMNT_0023330055 /DNA_START=100 /DNA_END=366 /DNA_ORIENTATION=+